MVLLGFILGLFVKSLVANYLFDRFCEIQFTSLPFHYPPPPKSHHFDHSFWRHDSDVLVIFVSDVTIVKYRAKVLAFPVTDWKKIILLKTM